MANVASAETKKEVPKKKFVFMDEDEESDDDEEVVIKKPIVSLTKVKPIIGDRPFTDYIFANADNYAFKSWGECFPDNKVSLRSLIFNPGWNEFFDIIERKPYFKAMEKILSEYLSKNKELPILPYAELVFNTMNVLSPKQIRVVIMGQDPYPGMNKIGKKMVPEAMGICFSVPLNYPKPLSLQNIFQNLLDFGHIKKIPNGGCLAAWVMQGCCMPNASLTTLHTKKNIHKNVWKNFTDDWLAYINQRCKNVVFVVWGKEAHMLCQNIDPYKHRIITSSHPSPLGFEKTMNGFAYGKVKNSFDRKPVTYPPFKTLDHFGRVNEYLKSVGKKEIMWDLIQ